MNVSSVAQTLSRLVAVALHTLKDHGFSQFQNCEATAEFIEVGYSVQTFCMRKRFDLKDLHNILQ